MKNLQDYKNDIMIEFDLIKCQKMFNNNIALADMINVLADCRLELFGLYQKKADHLPNIEEIKLDDNNCPKCGDKLIPAGVEAWVCISLTCQYSRPFDKEEIEMGLEIPSTSQKSLRDEFAMAALNGYMAKGTDEIIDHDETLYTIPLTNPKEITQYMYKIADAMMKEREK